jgi:hypothetical protein
MEASRWHSRQTISNNNRARKILTIDANQDSNISHIGAARYCGAAEFDYSFRIDEQLGQIFVKARRRLFGFCFACCRSMFAGERPK